MARRLEQLATQFEHDVRPIFGHLNAIGRDASRAAALATVQVERADKLFSEIATRVEQTLNDGPGNDDCLYDALERQRTKARQGIT
jgi:hypothetical protein